MREWFTIDIIDKDTYIISEYRHWEETHCYLLNGSERSLLIDTGLGISNIYDEVCFWEKERGYLFTGDLVYKDTLFAYYPSTDPEAYLKSLEIISELPAKRIFPAHHSLEIQPEIVTRMRDAFQRLDAEGKLKHGSGTFDYGDWAVWL